MLDRVVDLVDEAVGQIRTSIFQLRAQPHDLHGLRKAVLATVAEVRPALGFAPHVRFEGPLDALSDPELTGDVLRGGARVALQRRAPCLGDARGADGRGRRAESSR